MHEAHHHYCPDCSERPLCHEDCDTERNLDGALRGGTVMCDRCAAARVAAAPRGAASTKQQLAELREAARAFLDAFALQAVRCAICEKEGKREPIMVREGPHWACDAHGRELLEAPVDLSYAPALRRLRALISEEG